jgi:Sec-independent protein translocase protein TatA
MSFGELCVVAIVAIIIMKPEDLPIIIKKIKYARKYIAHFKTEIINYFDKELRIDHKELEQDVDEINSYIKKIINLGSDYEGDYSLEDVKDKYKRLVTEKINQEKDRA